MSETAISREYVGQENHLNELDVMKGIGIICAVMDHAGIPNFFFYPFEVSLFYLIGGYCFNIERCSSIERLMSYIGRQGKRLYVPLILWNVMFILLNNVFMNTGIYTDNPFFLKSNIVENQFGLDAYLSLSETMKQIFKVLLLMDTAKICGMSWFIRALIVIKMGYAVVSFIVYKIKANIVSFQLIFSVGVVAGMLIVIHWHPLPYSIVSIIEYYMMFSVGNVLRNKVGFLRPDKILTIISTVIIIINAIVQYKLSYSVTVLQVLSYLMASIAAFYLSWMIATIISNHGLKIVKIVNGGVSYVGLHTMPIIFLQFFSFKLVTWIEVQVYNLPHYCLASFPIIKMGLAWSFVLLIAGILIPLALDCAYGFLRKTIWRMRSNEW